MKWEYKKEEMTKGCVGALNCLGNEGWELCGVGFEGLSEDNKIYATFFFKRPIPEPSIPPSNTADGNKY